MAVAAGRPNGGGLRLVVAVVLALVLGVLAAFGVLTYRKYRDEGNKQVAGVAATADVTSDDGTAAVAAARLEAVNLTTIDYKTTDAAVARILAGATGTLKTQFTAQRAQLGPLLASTKSTSVGSVLEAGLVKLSGSNAEVLVAVDASVTTQPAGTTKPQNAVKHYRMSMKLQHVGTSWLVSDVGFTGLAQ